MNSKLIVAIKAAIAAGKVIMDVYNSNFEVELKTDDSPLTQADKRANTIINSFLEPTAIPIISEENKQIDYELRKPWEAFWMVDPLDGTKEFIKRNGEFTVNIAYIKSGRPLLGVIYVPASKTLYYGDVLDGKAFKVNIDDHSPNMDYITSQAEPLKPKRQSGKALSVVASRSHLNTATQDFVNQLEKSGHAVTLVSRGSSLKFCMVAEGKANLYPRFAPTMEWDTAAGHSICNAVGIEVTDHTTQQPLQYNKENLLNPWFMVSIP